MSAFDAPIPLSDIEAVLAWVDEFKLSRPTKKINRDFSDAEEDIKPIHSLDWLSDPKWPKWILVSDTRWYQRTLGINVTLLLLAEILNTYYPKLVEMHNYPPRNSHALKLNNWMTLNRKVLRKLKLNLCCSTMEQLANSASGVIERVLIMVRDKIRRDEELNKSKDGQEALDSGGTYYEACGDDEHVLVVPVKSRINGILETIQQKVVSHDMYLALKQELKDMQDCNELLKNKVEHLDNLIKLKDERIDELQKQLERKQTRKKEVEVLVNSLYIPFEPSPPSPKISDSVSRLSKSASLKLNESLSKVPMLEENKSKDEVKITKSESHVSPKCSATKPIVAKVESASKIPKLEECYVSKTKIDDKPSEETVLSVESMGSLKKETESKHSANKLITSEFKEVNYDVDKVESDIFKEIEVKEQISDEYIDEFKDSVDNVMFTVEDSIKREVKEITNALEYANENYI